MLSSETLELEPQAFCYWLQGSIEIGELTTFDAQQARIVLRTLSNVKNHNVFTLQALLLIGSLPPHAAFVHINSQLQQMFIHDIDNSYGGDQEFLHLVHTGKEKVIDA